MDLYHFTVTAGTSRWWRRSSPGGSARRSTPASACSASTPDGTLAFVAGDNNTGNATTTDDGLQKPLLTDSVLYAGLTPGDYYVAVAGGFNTPSPLEGQHPRQLRRLRSQRGPAASSPERLDHRRLRPESAGPAHPRAAACRLEQPGRRLDAHPGPDASGRHVRPADGPRGPGRPVVHGHLRGTSSRGSTSRGPTGRTTSLASIPTTSPPIRRRSTCSRVCPTASMSSTSPAQTALSDMYGSPIAGNDPSGDYVVPFTVNAAPRGDGGNPLQWTDQEPNDSLGQAQDIGVLFPNELATTGSRSPATSARTPPRPRRIRPTSTSSRSSCTSLIPSPSRAMICPPGSRCR